MPNLCTNKLSAHGNSFDLKKFYEENIINEELSFNKSVPCTHENWYEEHSTKWGTRSDAFYTRILSTRFDNGLFICDFRTAWNPPIFWFERISEKYSMLTFILSWDEFLRGLNGTIISKKGEITKNPYVSKSNNDHIVKSIKAFYKKLITSNIEIKESFVQDVIQDFKDKVEKLDNNLSYNTISRAYIQNASVSWNLENL
jgi:hypothetical protein